MQIITRKEAIEKGLPRYFTGKPCVNGHISERVTKKCDCVECNNERNSAYRAIPENAEKARLRVKAWRDEKGIEVVYQNNKEWKAMAYGSEAEYWRQYYEKRDREKLIEYARNRRARISNSEGRHTAKDISKILERQSYCCVYCGDDLNDVYHVDHIMPIALGGSNWPDNLQCLCPTCNIRKGAKHPDDWHREIGFSD